MGEFLPQNTLNGRRLSLNTRKVLDMWGERDPRVLCEMRRRKRSSDPFCLCDPLWKRILSLGAVSAVMELDWQLGLLRTEISSGSV